MDIRNVPINKGPDRWRLAEALFSHGDYPGDDAPTYFTVSHQGKDYGLKVKVVSIEKVLDEEGTFLIEGHATVTPAKGSEKLLEHVPVKLSYSVHTRHGLANVNF